MKANNDLIDITYYIKNNEDWNNLKEEERVVDISNDAYFGFRAMERKAKNIKYDPSIIDSLVRVGKESKKFSSTRHLLVLDEETLSYESKQGTEAFIKASTRIIEELLSYNEDLKLSFNIIRKDGEESKIINILNELYLKNT